MSMNFTDLRPTDPATRLWRELCFAKKSMSLDELRDVAAVDAETLITCLGSWARMQCISASNNPFGFIPHEAARELQSPPVERADVENEDIATMRRRMWSAIKVLKDFDLQSLVMSAEVKSNDAREYLQALVSAGYLFTYRKKGDDSRRWWLKNWTGPLHPRIAITWVGGRPRPLIYDPNTATSYLASDPKNFDQDDSPCLSV